jgi:manganese/iron transport system ATP-binding protein
VRAGYGDSDVFRDVSLTVGPGELVALVGPNGAGKSTLLKVIAGLLTPREGTVRVLGAPPERSRLRLAYLPQAEELRWDFPLSVEDIVLTGLVARLGIGRRADATQHVAARGALDRVGAAYLLRRTAAQLSGGERQRVLLARTLLAAPVLYLLDEPATGVDPTTEEQLMGVLEGLARDGKTVLVATHDLAGVIAHFGRVLCMNRGIVADGPVSLLENDAVLRATYGGHRPGDRGLIADEHHG